ncbi:MAG TPA: GGDEF domain-containing protein [Verrucomicrobiae bacterium]|nr:GGDEF domain-containing protein [Verrucomicrobiae bacterium]
MPYDAPRSESAAPEIAPVYTPEGRRLRQSTESEAELRAKAEAARERMLAAAAKAETDPERVQAELDFKEANLDLETFDLTHDPTGALKREAIGADLAGQLSEMLAKQAEGAPLASAEAMTPVFLVNMGELDRLNKVSPDFGNEALTKLADVLSAKMETALGPIADGELESYYKIYRADNNSFMVRFMRPVPREVAEALREHLSIDAGLRWDEPPAEGQAETDQFAKRGVETPPVIADFVSLEEVMAGLPPSLRGSGKAETYAVGAVKDVLFSLQDAHKIVSRVERIRGLKNDEEARDLYDKFLKKSLAGVFQMETGPQGTTVPVETFEQFKAYLASLEADPVHATGAVWETAFGKVLADLRVRYEKDTRYAKQLQGFVADKVKAEYGLAVQERRSSAPPGVELPADTRPNAFEEPDRTTATEGLALIHALEAKADADYANPQEKRIAQKELARERAKRDYATGLELRGPMFKRLEGALADGTKRVAAVSMDMGFLKYFDQVGGRETGDLAILKMAETFQKVKDKFSKEGIDVSVHRLGGDEFGMTVIGDAQLPADRFREILDELRADLQIETERAGRIPPKEGAKPAYFATNINLGVGVHFYEDGAAAAAEDARYELTDADTENVENARAEHLLKVADKVLGFQKSSNRLLLMLERMKALQDARAAQAPEDQIRVQEEHLKQLLAFSDKAIFGQAGRDMLKEWEARLKDGEAPEALDQDVHEFVWQKMEESFQEDIVERGDLEASVEYAVRIEYLRDRVRTLEGRLEVMGKTGENERARREHEVKKVKERLSAAEEDLERMKALRASLGAGGRV